MLPPKVPAGIIRVTHFLRKPAQQGPFEPGRTRRREIGGHVAIDRGGQIITERARVHAAARYVTEVPTAADILAAAVDLLGENLQRLTDVDRRLLDHQQPGLNVAAVVVHENRFFGQGRQPVLYIRANGCGARFPRLGIQLKGAAACFEF
jgi:hypothetical protein